MSARAPKALLNQIKTGSERKKLVKCNKVEVKFPYSEPYTGRAFLQDILRPEIRRAVEGIHLTKIS